MANMIRDIVVLLGLGISAVLGITVLIVLAKSSINRHRSPEQDGEQ